MAGEDATPSAPAGGLAELYWGIQVQTIDIARLDPYLASVGDQDNAMREASAYAGRLVLRSQVRSERFWLLDAWRDRISLETGAITLRTLSSVAGLTEAPREIRTEQVSVGSAPLTVPDDRVMSDESEALPFYPIVENRVKRVRVDDYLESQSKFVGELEQEEGYRLRLLLRDVEDPCHFFVIDEWATERQAFEAFERRQGSVSEIEMTRFLALLQERPERDFALGLHG